MAELDRISGSLRVEASGNANSRAFLCQNLIMSFLDRLLGKSPKKSPDDLVRDALRKEGDNGTKIRSVDHLAYFKTMDATQEFMQWAIDNGYTLSAGNHEFGVGFCRDSAVVGTAFDNELATIHKKIKSLKGEYDGWGCPVTKV